jgi:hypothetical protein
LDFSIKVYLSEYLLLNFLIDSTAKNIQDQLGHDGKDVHFFLSSPTKTFFHFGSAVEAQVVESLHEPIEDLKMERWIQQATTFPPQFACWINKYRIK